MKPFKQHISEKLKISPNNTDNYVFKTKQVNLNNFEKFSSYMLDNRTFELFYDYFYCRVKTDSKQDYIKDNNITYDSIYLDYDGEDTFVLDNDSGDEIMKSEGFNPEYFYVCYSNIIDYFEDKNI